MKKTIKHVISSITVIFFLFIAFGTSDEKKTEKEVRNETPDIEITAAKLYSDYEENGVAADQKYKDKIIKVTGYVDNIDRDITNTIYVTLKANEYIGSVQCFFADDHVNTAANLKKGQKVTIKGKCEGKLMNVMLKGCVVD